jgi:hypothetical protein
MTSHLHSTLSVLQCHQLHLHVSDGGFSLPDMLLVRECAFPASFAQCIHDVTDILTLLRPLTIDDILCASRYYHDPSNIPPPIASFLHHPNPIFIAFFDAVAFLTIYDPALSVQSHSVLIPSSNTPYTTAAINTPSLHLSTPCNNSMTPPILPTTIHPLMMTLEYGPASMPVLVTIP